MQLLAVDHEALVGHLHVLSALYGSHGHIDIDDILAHNPADDNVLRHLVEEVVVGREDQLHLVGVVVPQVSEFKLENSVVSHLNLSDMAHIPRHCGFNSNVLQRVRELRVDHSPNYKCGLAPR